MANSTNTRWKNFMHNGQSQFMYIHENELKLTDLDLHKSPKCKLKLLPSDVSKEKVRVFVLSLIKSIDYEGGLLIELDDYVANLIGSEDLITKRKVKAMMTASNFELLKMKYEPKSNTNIAAYSKFKYIVVIDNKELKMNLEETDKLYRCEVRIFGSRARKPEHTTKSESEDESNVDDFSGSSLLDEPDGLGGDDNTADNEDNDGNGYEEVLEENEQNSKNKFVQLSFGDGQRKSLYPALKLETCKLDILRKHIYEGAIKHYNIQPNEIEAFYLGLALTHVNKSLNAKAEKFKLQWMEESLKQVLQVIVTDFKTDFLEQLLNRYESFSTVKKNLLMVAKNLDNLDENLKKYTDFLDISSLDCFMILFIDAIETNKFDASLYYWTKQDNLIGTALLAQYVLKRKKKKAVFQTEKDKYEKYLKIYEDIAVTVLRSCYGCHRSRTSLLLINISKNWKESCITLALQTKNKLFLQQEACVMINDVHWRTYLGDAHKSLQSSRDKKESFLSPHGRCKMDMISYLIFLTAYSFLLVSTLHQTTFHWLEAVVMVYIVTFIVKEFDQYFKNLKRSWRYIYDPFNILDMLSITIAILAWSLRWAAYTKPEEERLMIAARYLLCLNFMLYMFRFLEFFYQNKFLGPILVLIINMVKTYIYFLLILAIFWVTYSVVSESILFPEKELEADIVYSVFRRGFWAMMGEYFLDEIEHYSVGNCNNLNSVNTSINSCPTKDGEYSVPVLLAAYVLFVQILMFSLLIALFNNAISENEAKRDMIWRYQKFLMTLQYSKSKILLPPFLIVIFLLKGKYGNPFKSDLRKKNIFLKNFEKGAAKKIIYEIIHSRYGKNDAEDMKAFFVAQVNKLLTELPENVLKRLIMADLWRGVAQKKLLGFDDQLNSSRLEEDKLTGLDGGRKYPTTRL